MANWCSMLTAKKGTDVSLFAKTQVPVQRENQENLFVVLWTNRKQKIENRKLECVILYPCNNAVTHSGEGKMAKASKKVTQIKKEIKARKSKMKKQVSKIKKLKKALKKIAQRCLF